MSAPTLPKCANEAEVLAKYPFAEKLVASEAQIKARLAVMARQIATAYAGKGICFDNPLLLVGILKGASLFISDLMRAFADIGFRVELDLMSCSSYHGGTASSGTVQKVSDLRVPLKGRHVLVCDDIVDTAYTFTFLRKELQARGPASLNFCTLLDKVQARKVPFVVDFVAFTIPTVFVIGYGLDFNERLRELRDIVVLKPEYYQPGTMSKI
jgi:hypoxanthine phosphoribosyltransferase